MRRKVRAPLARAQPTVTPAGQPQRIPQCRSGGAQPGVRSIRRILVRSGVDGLSWRERRRKREAARAQFDLD